MNTKPTPPPPSPCPFCGKSHPIKQLCKARMEAYEQDRRKSDTKRKGWHQ